jgi:hypothetical protein
MILVSVTCISRLRCPSSRHASYYTFCHPIMTFLAQWLLTENMSNFLRDGSEKQMTATSN